MSRKVTELISKVILSDKIFKIKLLGDSITHGVGGTGFLQNGEPIVDDFARNPDGYCWAKQFKEHFETNYNCVVNNNACTGTTIEFVSAHFDQLVNEDDDLVICTIGTNNRHQYFEQGPKHTKQEHMDAFYSNVIALYEKFRKVGKDVIFMANIPASAENEKDGENYWRLFHMNDVNDMYMKASVQCGFPFISMYNMFSEYCDLKGRSVDSYLSDGLHPNDEGYDVMFRLIMRALGLGVSIK